MSGAVKHEDALAELHGEVMDRLLASGVEWSLVGPNSVMETTLLPYRESIRMARAIFCCAADSKVGLISLKNVAEIAALVLATDGHHGQNYVITGPASVTLTEVAATFTKILGKQIDYIDMTEDQFAHMMMKYDKTLTRERVEMEALCHFRAWKSGGADIVTDTYKKLMGTDPMSVEDFIMQYRDYFAKGIAPGFLAKMARKSIMK